MLHQVQEGPLPHHLSIVGGSQSPQDGGSKKDDPAEPKIKFDIEVQFFAAMKNIFFDKYMSRSLGQMLQSRGQEDRAFIEVAPEPFVEPNCPEWFDDCRSAQVNRFSIH